MYYRPEAAKHGGPGGWCPGVQSLSPPQRPPYSAFVINTESSMPCSYKATPRQTLERPVDITDHWSVGSVAADSFVCLERFPVLGYQQTGIDLTDRHPVKRQLYAHTTDTYTLHYNSLHFELIPDVFCFTFSLYRATLCVSAVFAVGRCPSVCPSVTFVYCIQTAEDLSPMYRHQNYKPA